MFGAFPGAFGAGFTPRSAERGGLPAMRAALPRPSLGVAPARRGVPGRLTLHVDNRARPAERGALERFHAAACTLSGGPAGGVRLPVGRPSLLKADLATGAALHGRIPAAPNAKAGLAAGTLKLPAAQAGVAAFGSRVLAPVFQVRGASFAVPGPFGRPSLSSTGCAKAPARLVRVPAALGAGARRNTRFGPLARTPVFGPADVGVPDPPDAGRTASGGPGSISGPALGPAHLAGAPALHGGRASAARAKTRLDARLGKPAFALAGERALPFWIVGRHCRGFRGRFGTGSAGECQNRRLSAAACGPVTAPRPRSSPTAVGPSGCPARCR